MSGIAGIPQDSIRILSPFSATQSDSRSVKTPEQKTALAGRIARACAVFCVDEIIVFDDGQAPTRPPEKDGYTAYTDPNYFLYHILSYLETPPHLRKDLFPIHRDLEGAGSLPSLDMPHHLRSDERCPYREGIALRMELGEGGGVRTLVECGLRQTVSVPIELERNTRVTVRLEDGLKDTTAEPTSPDAPREEAGYYWGYATRQAASLSNIFTECPYDGGYDMSIGTSERGIPVPSLSQQAHPLTVEPKWTHLLVVFGGIAGLEAALAVDTELRSAGVEEASDVFDRWVNLVPGQGSRTIRTEEAVWVGLTALRPLVEARNNRTS